MTFAMSLQETARLLAERTANSLLEGIGIALFAWMLLQLIGRRNSSTRFAVWLAALGGIVALPWLSGIAWHTRTSLPPSSSITVPAIWATLLFCVWALFAGVMLSRIALSLSQIWRLRRYCQPVPMSQLQTLPQATLQDIQSTRGVTVNLSDRVSVPTAIGFFKPAILLPTWAMSDLSPAELNSILIHELAHLQRRDDWTNLAQNILRALFFFHPAVWWVDKQLSVEREMACDDVVLAHTSNPRAYAECLVSVAEKSFLRRGLALAQAVVGRMHQTSQRISQILDAKRPGATRVWKPALALIGAFSAVSVAYVAATPELVAFRDAVPTVASASVNPKPISASYSADAAAIKAVSVRANVPSHEKRVSPRSVLVVKANPEPSVIQAKLDQTPNSQVQMPAATLVVFQQLDRENVVWTVYVWQVMFVSAPAQHNIPAKQI